MRKLIIIVIIIFVQSCSSSNVPKVDYFGESLSGLYQRPIRIVSVEPSVISDNLYYVEHTLALTDNIAQQLITGRKNSGVSMRQAQSKEFIKVMEKLGYDGYIPINSYAGTNSALKLVKGVDTLVHEICFVGSEEEANYCEELRETYRN